MKTPEEMAEELKPCPLCGEKVTLEQVTDSWSVEDRYFGGTGSGTSYMHSTYNMILCTCGLQKTLSRKAYDVVDKQVQGAMAATSPAKYDPNESDKRRSFGNELREKYIRAALIVEWNNRV